MTSLVYLTPRSFVVVDPPFTIFVMGWRINPVEIHACVTCCSLANTTSLEGNGLLQMPGASSKNRRAPASLSQLDPNDVIDPPAIVKILRNNWSSHIPLTDLTTARCQSSLFVNPSSTQSLSLLDDGKIHLELATPDASKEASISYPDFMEASPRLCNMIRNYLPGDAADAIADAWQQHFAHIISRNDFALNFSQYMTYDRRLRQHYVLNPDSFNPAVFQLSIWNDIVRQHQASELSSFKTMLTKLSSNGGGSSTSRDTSFRGRGSSSRGGRGGGRSGSNASRGLCYICRSAAHKGRDCVDATNGYISKGADGIWKTAAGATVCFRHNIGTCTHGSCTHAHTCSCCGSSEHNAQTHT